MAILNNSNAISSGGYDINNSLRFRSSATASLSRTPAGAGNLKTFTWSAWVKRGLLDSSVYELTRCYINTSNNTALYFNANSLNFQCQSSAVTTGQLATTQVFRDPSAWYHIVLSVDTTQATAANRLKLYVNGIQITAFSATVYPSQNTDLTFNTANITRIGAGDYPGFPQPFDGYLTEVNFIDGQQLAPSSFGETDTTTGVWKPKAYTGTYGTNGFYLKFSDIATTSGSNAGLGKDFSGNANYWTTNNISVTAGTTYDAMTDVPTNTSATVANYAVMNPLGYTAGTTATLSSGNLNFSGTGYGSKSATLSLPSSGKYYAEFQITSTPENGPAELIGIASSSNPDTISRAYASNGQYFNGTSFVTFGSAWSINDIIGVAMDITNSQLSFYKNNTLQGSTQTYAFTTDNTTSIRSRDTGTSTFVANFGQRPFAYTPPTGFVRLNTYNL